MSKQLIFDLPVETGFGREDYFVSPANQLAVGSVADWQNWANGRLVLTGQTGSGKTHLLSIWAKDLDAEVLSSDEVTLWRPKAFARPIAIDGLSQSVDEDALFLMLNHLQAQELPVMITALKDVAFLGLSLPDLISRLDGSSKVTLNAVDDTLLSAVFLKLMTDRQLVCAPDVAIYALTRVERSLDTVKKLVDRLDHLSLQKKKAVTKHLVGEVLGDL
ncbi:MAG: chromosomal replication initiator DnaA [Pseudomonadota bacterium]